MLQADFHESAPALPDLSKLIGRVPSEIRAAFEANLKRLHELLTSSGQSAWFRSDRAISVKEVRDHCDSIEAALIGLPSRGHTNAWPAGLHAQREAGKQTISIMTCNTLCLKRRTQTADIVHLPKIVSRPAPASERLSWQL